MKTNSMKAPTNSSTIVVMKPEQRNQRAEVAALEEMPDDRTDTTDVPEILDWSDAWRGVFHRPVKQQLTLR